MKKKIEQTKNRKKKPEKNGKKKSKKKKMQKEEKTPKKEITIFEIKLPDYPCPYPYIVIKSSKIRN